MKKIVLTLHALLFALLLTPLQAQQNKQAWVIGNWKVAQLEIPHYEQLIAKANPEQKKKYQEELKSMAQSASFEFRKDGTYLISFTGITETGKWSVNQYASQMTKQEKAPDGQFKQPDQVGIEVLTKNTMVLLNDYESGEIFRITLKK